MRVFKYLFLLSLAFWELPQNILGLVMLVILRFKSRVLHTEMESFRFFVETKHTGVSLGSFVFWTKAGNRFPELVNDCRMHEYGHTKQSIFFGPFYLVVIGIPSLARVLYGWCYRKKHGRRWERYFHGYPENWADKLGGVISGSKKKLPE